MSAISVAELLVAFKGDTTGFDKANVAVQSGLKRTGITAEETSEALLQMAAAASASGSAFETASVQAATYTRVALDAAKASQAAAAAFAEATKGASSVEAALDIATVAARAAAASFTTADKAAVDLGIATAAAKVEVQGLGRAFASPAATGYAAKLDAGATAASVMEVKVATLTAQVTALNTQLAQTKATGFPSVPSGVGGGQGGQKGALGTANKIGKGLTNYVTAPILLAGGAALAIGSEYEAATAQLQSFAGVSAREVDALRPKFLSLAETTGQMPATLARAMFFIESGGIRGKAGLDVLTQAAKASTAGLGKLEDVAQAMTSAKYSFGIPAKDIGDIVAKAAVLAHADPGVFFKSLGQAIPTAAALKIKLQDVMGIVAIMTREGLSPAKGFQRIAALMDSVTVPTPKQRNVAQMLGIDFGEFRKEMQTNLGAAFEEVYEKAKGRLDLIKQFFGGRKAGDAAVAFLNPNAIRENVAALEGMAKSAGTVDKAFTVASGTLKVQAAQMKASLEGAAIAAEAALAPAAKAGAIDVRHLADAFSQLTPRTQANIVEALALAAAVGPVVRGVVGLTTATKAILGPLAAYSAAQKAAQISSFGVSAGANAAKASIGAMAGAYAVAAALMAIPIIITVKTVYDYKDAVDNAAKSGAAAAAISFSPRDYRQMRRRQGSTADNYALNDEFKKTQYYKPFMESTTPGGAAGLAARHAEAALRAKEQAQQESDAESKAEAIAKRIAAVTGGKGFDTADSGAITGRKKGRGGSGGASETDQLLQSLQDRVGSLSTSYLLLGKDADAASLKQEILGGEFASATQKAQALRSVLADLRSRGTLDVAAKDLFGKNATFDSLGGTAKLKAEAYAIQLVTDKRKAGALAAKEEADAVTQALKSAQEEANQATQAAKDANAAESPSKSREDYLHEFSRKNYGKDYANLQAGPAKDAASQYAEGMVAKDKAEWAKVLAEVSGKLADNQKEALDKSAENLAKRAKESAEATAKASEQLESVLRSIRQRETDIGTTIADRRTQYVGDQVGKLGSVGNPMLDAARTAIVAKESGAAFDAKSAKAYADQIGDLTRDLDSLGRQTDAARLASIRFNREGTEVMTQSQGQAVLALQKTIERVQAYMDTATQAGDAVGRAFGDGMNAAMQGGARKGIAAMLKSIDDAIRQAVLANAERKVAAWATGTIMGADPSKKGQASPKGDGWLSGIGFALDKATGGGKNASLDANTKALVALNLTMGGSSGTDGLVGIACAAGVAMPSWIASLSSGLGLAGTFGKAAPSSGAVGNVSSIASILASIPHFATGGDVQGGKPVVVGDGGDGSGSELFVPRESGAVLPHHLTQQVMGAASKGAESGAESSTTNSGSETHNHFYSNQTFHVAGPVDRRSEMQIRSAAFRGANEAYEAAK